MFELLQEAGNGHTYHTYFKKVMMLRGSVQTPVPKRRVNASHILRKYLDMFLFNTYR